MIKDQKHQEFDFYFLVQRYGEDVVGGAENHARMLAEKLVNQGYRVCVLTTTAKSYQSWANAYQRGVELINGVFVERFWVNHGRIKAFNLIAFGLQKLIRFFHHCGFRSLGRFFERIWLFCQGPISYSLRRRLKDLERNDILIIFTYLYEPSVYALTEANCRKWLVPTAHDEPPFYFTTIQDALKRADRILANSKTESLLLQKTLQVPVEIVGVGIDTERYVPGSDYEDRVVYMGRVGHSKAIPLLCSYFLKSQFKGVLNLIGPLEKGYQLPSCAQIIYLGILDEEDKISNLQKAKCLVNPSEYESLSLVCLEAMACQVPLLLNARCEVFQEYAHRFASVFLFHDEASFREALAKISQINWKAPPYLTALVEARNWVKNQYSWAVVLKKLLQN